MAGQAIAGLALFLFALQSHTNGIAPANAAQLQLSTGLVPDGEADFNLTVIFAVLAILLLALSNFCLWHQRKGLGPNNTYRLDPTEASQRNAFGSRPGTVSDKTTGSQYHLGHQYRIPAEIADPSQRAKFDIELSGQDKIMQLSRISHELRTPLNAVIGFSDLMRQEMFGPLGHDKYIEYAEHIGESGQNLLNAVDDIFELTYKQDTE